jgi:cysteinyl-tRNA synthetase
LDKFYNALLKNADVPVNKIDPSEKLIEALADDLNTPLALSYLHETVNELNKAESLDERTRLKSQLMTDAYMLGLLYNDPEKWFKGEGDDAEAAEIETLIAKRTDAKKNKDWATADAIRNELKERGIILEDSPTGTTWKRI